MARAFEVLSLLSLFFFLSGFGGLLPVFSCDSSEKFFKWFPFEFLPLVLPYHIPAFFSVLLVIEKSTAIFDSPDLAKNGEALLQTLTERKWERLIQS
jgi:hypothetical protein